MHVIVTITNITINLSNSSLVSIINNNQIEKLNEISFNKVPTFILLPSVGSSLFSSRSFFNKTNNNGNRIKKKQQQQKAEKENALALYYSVYNSRTETTDKPYKHTYDLH